MGKWTDKFKKPRWHKWFAKQNLKFGTVPKPEDPNKIAKGKYLYVEGEDEPVKVERVTGNINDPKKYEINGQYLISMLDFYTQLTERRRPTADELAEWDSIELLQMDIPSTKGNA